MSLLLLGLHSSFLPLSSLDRKQQGGNCLSSPHTAVRRKLWWVPSSPKRGGLGRASPAPSNGGKHFSISCMHTAPVMSSSGFDTDSLTHHKQGSLAQVETWEAEGRFLSKGKQGKCWIEFSEQWPLETPQEAAAQLARPVSGSCAPRNRERHTYGRVGLCHLPHARANHFTSGKLEVGGFRREVTAH